LARQQEPALQRGVLLRVGRHRRPGGAGDACGLAQWGGQRRTARSVRGTAAWPLWPREQRPPPASHRPASLLPGTAARSRLRLRCRVQCHDRPSDRSAQPGL